MTTVMKIGTIRFLFILFMMIIPFRAQAQMEWGVNEAFNTIVADRGVTALSSIHTSSDRAFVSAALSDFTNRLFYSDDDGASWTEVTSDNNTGIWTTFANAGNDVIYSFGTDIFGNRYLRKSTDNGTSWTVQTADYSNFPFIFIPTRLEAISDTLILTSTAKDAGMLKSSDGGATWNMFDVFDDEDGDNNPIDHLFDNGEFFFIASSSNGFYRSRTDSVRWNRVRAFGSDENVEDDIFGAVINESTGRIFVLTDNGVEYSDDNGDNWTLVSLATLGITEGGVPQGIEMLGDDILIQFLGQDVTRMVLVQGLNSSTTVNDGLGDFENTGRFLSFPTTSKGIAFGNRLGDATQLWQFGMGVATSNEDDAFSPESFTLEQNFPNPFNPTTNIRFSLNEASTISLTVYNLLGQQIASVASGRFSAGEHTFSFDASSLSSGVYIYQLRNGSNLLTRKMTLIK